MYVHVQYINVFPECEHYNCNNIINFTTHITVWPTKGLNSNERIPGLIGI